MHTNHPDYDWGLWGHNLVKVIKDEIKDEMYATIDGKKNTKQLCFSSNALYDVVRNYIIDQYGVGYDFFSEGLSIMAMVNMMACSCK